MRQPPSFEKGSPRSVCRLRKAIYGLRQSSHEWAKAFAASLERRGLQRLRAEPCVSTKQLASGIALVVILVDDVLVATRHRSDYDEILAGFREDFDVTDLALAQHFQGTRYHEGRDRQLLASQTAYIDATLARFGMADCKFTSLPLDLDKLHARNPSDGEAPSHEIHEYQARIGALLWLSRSCRPDVSHAVQALSQFAANPSAEHHAKLKKLLRYLQGSRTAALRLQPNSSEPTSVFTDTDWAHCSETRQSVSGVTVFCFGALVSWRSRKQRSVATSTGEAEYVALAEGLREAHHVRNILLELNIMYRTRPFCESDNEPGGEP